MNVPLIRRTESCFTGGGARTLFRRAWVPEAPERLVVLAHGYAEHSGRYEAVGSWLAARGCAVHAFDHQGHGRSDGPRGHVSRMADFFDDLDAFERLCRAEHPELPVFVLGHSMGGLIVAAWAEERRPQVTGLILSGAALVAGEVPPTWQVALLQVLRRVLPRLRMPRPIATEALSRDPEVGRRYQEDPLVFQFMTLSLAGALYGAGAGTLAGAGEVGVPTLVLHGGDDPIVLAEGSRRFFEGLRSSGSDLRIYPGLRHEIFNEPEAEAVLADALDWMRKQEPA